MGRSHPPTLIRLVERALVEECGVRRGDRILVATSGGGDSMALLHVLSGLSSRLGFSLCAHGVDHGLRPDAASELDLAAAFADRLGVAFARTSVDVGKGGNLQARARTVRRAALERAARREHAGWIATAHHAEDRAETVLIRMLGGARPSGLGVLPPRDGFWIRPMIRARKADVAAHLTRHAIVFASDPSNLDKRFLRARIRYELMPILEELSPKIVEHLCSLADELSGHALPEVMDAAGRPVALRRAQLGAIRRAIELERPVTVRISGGRELRFDPEGSKLAQPGTRRGRTEQKGGAKRRKSG